MNTTTDAAERSRLRGFFKYMTRWLLFGFIAGGLQPVVDFSGESEFWYIKFLQCLNGLPFGALCGVAFTLAQNKWNESRSRKRTWSIAIGTWCGVKIAIFGLVLVIVATTT